MTASPTVLVVTPTASEEELLSEKERLRREWAELYSKLEKQEATLAELRIALDKAIKADNEEEIKRLEADIDRLSGERDSTKSKLDDVEQALLEVYEQSFDALRGALYREIQQEDRLLICAICAAVLTFVGAVWPAECKELFKKIFKRTGIRQLCLTSPVPAGSTATLTIRVTPGAVCDAGVIYKSGKSSVSGLGPQVAGKNGKVTWTWQVTGNTTPGIWTLYVDCSPGGHMQWPFEVQ